MTDFNTIDDNALLLEETLAKLHDVVHGTVETVVETDNGPLPSLRRYMSLLPPADEMVISFGASGTLAERANWINANPGFTFLAEDVGYVYTRLHTGGWSNGVSFRATQWEISTRNPLSVDGEIADVWLNKSTTELFTKTNATTWVSNGNLSPGIADAGVDNKSYVRKNGQWVELVSADAQAIEDLQTAQSATDAALAAETQSRIDGDDALTTTLQAYIDAAVTNNTNADNAETVARVAADNLIKTELDLSQASIGLNANGSFNAFTTTNYINAATTFANAVSLLDTALKAENTRALAAEATNSGSAATVAANLATETTNRTSADTALSTAISTETTNRTAADTTLTTAVATINADAAMKNVANTFTKAQTVAVNTLTYGATTQTNAALSNTHRLVLTGNTIMANPTNLVDGQIVNYILRQNNVGGFVVSSWGSKFKWGDGTVPVLSSGINAATVICGVYDGVADEILCNASKNFA